MDYNNEKQRVLEQLSRKNGSSIMELRTALQRNGETLNKVLRKMKREGLIREYKKVELKTCTPRRTFFVSPVN